MPSPKRKVVSMPTRFLSIALAATLLCGLVGAARAAGPMTMRHGARTPADRAFAASNDAMMSGMAVEPTGDADRDFVAMMLPHHRGAVAMARVELRYGRDPELRRLAASIVKAQAVEIAEMRVWRRTHAR